MTIVRSRRLGVAFAALSLTSTAVLSIGMSPASASGPRPVGKNICTDGSNQNGPFYLSVFLCQDHVSGAIMNPPEHLPPPPDHLYLDRADTGPNPTHWDGWLGETRHSYDTLQLPQDGKWWRVCAHNDKETGKYYCNAWYH